MGDGDTDDRIDQGLAQYLPPDRTALEQVFRAIALAADLLPGFGAVDPGFGAAVKAAATLGVWFFDRRKVDRVFPVLLSVKDKLRDVETRQCEYVRKDEFKDLLEETLRRVADQPDPQRRDWLRNILLKVLDQPKDHAENRLFLRLADELSIEAHRLLSVNKDTARDVFSTDRGSDLLAQRTGIPENRIKETISELGRAGIIETDTLGQSDTDTEGFDHSLTSMGRAFLAYRNGATKKG